MRGLLILLVAVVPVLSGCEMFKLAAFNAVNEPHLYQDQENLKKRAAEFAREAWASRLAHSKADAPPTDFECGYLDGFADYLLKGGNGAPPAIPPTQLRRYQYLSPDGHSNIEDYYSGFAAGAADAKASGQRVYFTIPISSSLPKTDKSIPEHGTEGTIYESLPPPKRAEGDMTHIAPGLPAATVVSLRRNADVPPPPPILGPPAPEAHPLPAHPELLRLPQGNSITAPAPIGPANTAPQQPEQALPREFMLPILGGAGSR